MSGGLCQLPPDPPGGCCDARPAVPAALVAIAYNEGRTVEFLRKTLTLSHSWTVRVVEKLEKAGLVQKKTGTDKRAVALYLTEQGKKLSAEKQAALFEALRTKLG